MAGLVKNIVLCGFVHSILSAPSALDWSELLALNERKYKILNNVKSFVQNDNYTA